MDVNSELREELLVKDNISETQPTVDNGTSALTGKLGQTLTKMNIVSELDMNDPNVAGWTANSLPVSQV